MPHIICAIATDLFMPEVCARGRPAKKMTVVTVPKTAVHEDYRPPGWKNEIRCSWQGLNMQSKAQAASMKATPYHHFRLGVRRAYSRHHPAADFRRYNVSQLRQVPVARREMPWFRREPK